MLTVVLVLVVDEDVFVVEEDDLVVEEVFVVVVLIWSLKSVSKPSLT